MPHKRKKGGKKSKRSGEGRKQKVKDERAAFCACPNFESCNLASGTKARPALDL